jgi:hypothetical protein
VKVRKLAGLVECQFGASSYRKRFSDVVHEAAAGAELLAGMKFLEKLHAIGGPAPVGIRDYR